MPSVGVLCTELLKQTKNPTSSDIKLPRSEIVQNLSLMVGFLNWVKPTAGNYKLCCRMSQVIKRILDQFFEAEPEMVKEPTMLTPEFSASNGQWLMDGLDDLEWLNSIDWTRVRILTIVSIKLSPHWRYATSKRATNTLIVLISRSLTVCEILDLMKLQQLT
jgi:hypothetical protein